LHDGGFVWNSRAFYDAIGVENFLLCVLFLFPSDVVKVEFVLVFGCNFAFVGYENIPVLGCAQNCGPRTAFASSQYDQSLSQRSFINAIVANTRMIVTNQNLIVILLSGMFFFWKWWWRGDIKKMRLPSPKRFLVYLK
jgi:hypothetical protein